MNGGFDVALRVAQALGIETYGISCWDDARRKYACSMPKYLQRERLVHGLEDVEASFLYKFLIPGYLEQALRHGSCPCDSKDPIPSYQRLGINMEHFAALELNNAEFLGDAVLEIEVASWLFRTYPDYSPNKMVQSLLTTLHT